MLTKNQNTTKFNNVVQNQKLPNIIMSFNSQNNIKHNNVF